jgi:hypothetical protein
VQKPLLSGWISISMHVVLPFTAFWPHPLCALSSTTPTTFYLRIKMQTWDENFINKVVYAESENVFSVNFYDTHTTRFPRQWSGMLQESMGMVNRF